MQSSICVVIATYNRPDSFEKCVKSILEAKYEVDCRVDLLISIDSSPEARDIECAAAEIDWPYGSKKIRTFDYNLGLRAHLLRCGDLALSYRAVIVLEDDIVVGEDYFCFSYNAIVFYECNPEIAGISLYSPKINEMAGLPFSPQPSGFDTYFLQSTQSWGQCWTHEMWRRFKEWYLDNHDKPLHGDRLPPRVYSWPETSWKKYHMEYTVQNDLTWVYPYVSHSSNTSALGLHNRRRSATFEVELSHGVSDYRFPKLEESPKYDAFFERSGEYLHTREFGRKRILFDIYNTRSRINEDSYVASTRSYTLPVVGQFGLLRKPVEMNILRSVAGSDLTVYYAEHQYTRKLASIRPSYHVSLLSYFHTLDWHHALVLGLFGFHGFIVRKFGVAVAKVSNILGK